MSSVAVESRSWSRGRWWGLVALIFGMQLGLIFRLGDTSPIRPRPAAPVFAFKLAGSASAELLALKDPTLFARPHRQGLAKPTSLGTLAPQLPSFQWPEPTNVLHIAVGRLGTVFSQFIGTNEFNPLPLPASSMPTLTLPDLSPLEMSVEQSTLLLEGELAQRPLITPLPLRSCTNLDILTNSIVRIAVDAEGRPVSPTLLSGSGSRKADQYALEVAGAARFEPLGRRPADTALNPAADLSWGRMIFRWHTLPPPPTNAPAANP
jgi:hypothetical protein